MGVRARIADWPPKRDPVPAPGGHRGWVGGHQGVQGFKALHRLTRRRSKDVEFHENWTRPPSLAPLRHRSSSEVTLSECDGDEEPRGT
ncbi:SI1L3 protein, partial [Piaya cayana]|nr:SI1L3 protein [Piaya cayana]